MTPRQLTDLALRGPDPLDLQATVSAAWRTAVQAALAPAITVVLDAWALAASETTLTALVTTGPVYGAGAGLLLHAPAAHLDHPGSPAPDAYLYLAPECIARAVDQSWAHAVAAPLPEGWSAQVRAGTLTVTEVAQSAYLATLLTLIVDEDCDAEDAALAALAIAA